MKLDFVLTTCPYCGCGCNLYLQVLDGEITGVVPCKTHLITQGQLCIKGLRAHEFVTSTHRLIKPLIKKGGAFVEASWNEALNLVASKLDEIKNNYGPDSIGVLSSAKCTNEENYLLMEFTRAVKISK